ncbi:MAG: hypothetical protein WD003_02660, partial [Candidatus Paceibacterota bacterium]
LTCVYLQKYENLHYKHRMNLEACTWKPRFQVALFSDIGCPKHYCSFDFRGGGFFLKWKWKFLLGSAREVSRRCGGANNSDEAKQNPFLPHLGF